VKHALFKGLDHSIIASGTLRERHHGFAFPYLRGRHVEAPHSLFVVLSVDFYISRSAHGFPKNRDVEEFLLHNPSELAGQMAEHDQNIKIALVIGHEYLGFSRQDIFRALNLYPGIR
jgi:hypothetical protein